MDVAFRTVNQLNKVFIEQKNQFFGVFTIYYLLLFLLFMPMFIVTLGSAYKDSKKGERNRKAGSIKETRESKNQKRYTQRKKYI